MKKTLTFALACLAFGSVYAQKDAVKQAGKLAGKVDKIGDARTLIQGAMQNPETANSAETYYIAGKIEFDAFDNGFKKLAINPNDGSVNKAEMGVNLINGYKYFLQALPLDSVPNEKGKVKPKYSKDIASKISGHLNDFFNAGSTFYNEQKYYPEAYNAFLIYSDIHKAPYATKEQKAIPDSVVNLGYFNAGISAYSGKNLEAAANAFKKARLNNTENVQNFIYELACWQYLAQSDSTKTDIAKNQIKEIAEAGNTKFGLAQPLFLNNLINSMVIDGEMQGAVDKLSTLIASNPDKASLYGLRGYVYDRMGQDDASVEDYKKASESADVDFETLKNAAKKIYKVGANKWNNIEGATPAQRKAVENDYFRYAKAVTDKAKVMNANDSDLEYVIENIDYALDTFFNNKK